MNNIINYAETELCTIYEKPFNSVDSLILSQLCYIEFGELVGNINENRNSIKFIDLLKAEHFSKMFNNIPYGNLTKSLLFAVSSSPRFRDIRINYYVTKSSPISEKQFSAITFILDNSSAFIAFRGTDRSIIGWKEDFNMAFINPIPSQIEGVYYINKVSNLIPHSLYIGGHSKGGNIAVYSAMNCSEKLSYRIKSIFSHDGPGFRDEIIQSDKFNTIKSKINKTLPYSSLIGMLLQSHEDYHVIKSNALGGLMQHDPFSWEIIDNDFNYLEKISNGANYRNVILNQWLTEVSDYKRKLFVDALFDIFRSTNSKNLIEISQNWKKTLPLMIAAIKNMDSEIRSLIIDLFKELSTLYLKNLTHIDKLNMTIFRNKLISSFTSK